MNYLFAIALLVFFIILITNWFRDSQIRNQKASKIDGDSDILQWMNMTREQRNAKDHEEKENDTPSDSLLLRLTSKPLRGTSGRGLPS